MPFVVEHHRTDLRVMQIEADEIQQQAAQTSVRPEKERNTSSATSRRKDLFQTKLRGEKPVSQLAVE
jgi:hypothetical protein